MLNLPILSGNLLQRPQNFVLRHAETLNVEHPILRLVLVLQNPHNSSSDGVDRRRRPLDLPAVKDPCLARTEVKLQESRFQPVVEEMATHQTCPGQATAGGKLP